MALVYNPRTWTDGETVTMTMLNSEVRDPFADLVASWNSYTPTWTATTTNPDIGNGVLEGRFKQVGHTILFRIGILFGTTTTAGAGTYFFGLPPGLVPLYNNTGETMGTGAVRDVSPVNVNSLHVYLASSVSNTVAALRTTDDSLLTATNPITWATGDRLALKGEYEITY